MQWKGFLFGLSAGAIGVSLYACGGGDDSAASADGGVEGGAEAGDAKSDAVEPPDDASRVNCTLDNGGDPVALCTQKVVLSALRKAVVTLKGGVHASWDSTSGDPSDVHDVHDDVAYAAAIANYGSASTRYGDSEITAALDADLVGIVPLLKSELGAVPDEYSGELYTHLRDVAVGLRYLSQNPDADAIDAIADDYGRTIFGHFITMGPEPDAGTGDAGVPPVRDGVLVESKASLDYAPADVATGALALLDMAARHPSDQDASRWVDAAHASIQHIFTRGREASTKRYYRLLVPGGAPSHDDISPRAPAPSDLLTSEAAATVALALLRAQDLVDTNGEALARIVGYPLVDYANQAIAAANASPSLWDSQGGGYMEGSSPSRGVVYSNKPTRANAFMFGAIHRANVTSGTPQQGQLKPLRDIMTLRQPAHAGMLAVSPVQNAYFLEVSEGFDVAAPDAGSPGDPQSYVSAATFAACEGFNEQWFGVP